MHSVWQFVGVFRSNWLQLLTISSGSSDREEYFLDVTLRLLTSNSVEESLKYYVTPEVLEGANQSVFPPACNGRD